MPSMLPGRPLPPADLRAALSRRLPRGRGLLNLALLLAALLAFAVLAMRESPSPGIEVEVRDPPGGIDEVRVYVSGAVREPGVVTLVPGDRVAEAVAVAGGAAQDADLAALNLARRVVDEDHVHVPRVGESSSLINVNTASQRELESLPGIGPVRAGGIIAARAEAPFTSTDELVERGLVPASVYEGFKDLVTAVELALEHP
jgi:competence protein ComEA